ncbi:GntR family transcriptional regulator [Micromonospora echinaurantiaca]|uniref:GntR family transcriptional regulator n=1 Tax=Micromonospora echinaurantiaca TaxID=47857 RepID=UPI000B5AE2DA
MSSASASASATATLPSTAQLRAQHGVSTTVVRQAILVLQTQGWVQGVHGLGVFVADH